MPLLAGFIVGLVYHLYILNVIFGLVRIDARIPLICLAVGWFHWELQRLFANKEA